MEKYGVVRSESDAEWENEGGAPTPDFFIDDKPVETPSIFEDEPAQVDDPVGLQYGDYR